MKNSTGSVQSPKSGAGAKGARSSIPKTDSRYWASRITKRTYHTPTGEVREVAEWQVRYQLHARQVWVNLGTLNKAAAATKARDLYFQIKTGGWDSVLPKLKPETVRTPAQELTVGEYLDLVTATGILVPRTLLNYQNCFRTILSDAFGIKGDRSRFDYRGEGNQRWRKRIDGIRLGRVVPEVIEQWQRKFVTRAGQSPAAVAKAKKTANSYVRCARSLFSRKVLKRLGKANLLSPLPFDGVELFEAGSMKYVSKIEVRALIVAAQRELRTADPAAYAVFLLSLFAAMRKAEVDSLEWRMVDFAQGVIHLEQTEWLHLKTEDSAGVITVDEEVMAELKATKAGSKGAFVVQSNRRPRNDSVRAYYRCKPVFERLYAWLRAKGVTANKPLHELRKEMGALIATDQGIYAASRYLRHSDITTTARHYADHKARISVGLGKVLNSGLTVAAAEAAG